jgi:hypothetical protein
MIDQSRGRKNTRLKSALAFNFTALQEARRSATQFVCHCFEYYISGEDPFGKGEAEMDVSPYAVLAALGRARAPILSIGSAYLLSAAVGMGMVHAHNGLALHYRDSIVGDAQQTAVGKAMNRGMPARAAVGDFTGNLFLGAVPSTVMGLSVVMPFPWVAFRGWVGGIVSVDGEHNSRLRDRHERFYYLGVLLLQLIPYTLAGGTGVRLGLAFLFPKGRWRYPPERWMGLPADGVRDVGRIYLLVVPLFLIASLIEFLAR